TGRMVTRLRPPEKKPYHFDDLTVGPDGTVFLSDGSGMMWRVRGGGNQIEVFVRPGFILAPQGSALAPDGKTLYVSDYGGPIDAVDVFTGKVEQLELPADY